LGRRTSLGRRLMNQGDVYWYTFNPPDKRRPILILTRNSAIPFEPDAVKRQY
jgi:mRNA-degrading endonuclease toxin of MazEF toxin-antitoxin module